MRILDDFLGQSSYSHQSSPEDPLYHYTSPHGLKGIVENGTIWASNIHFLNDAAEYSHALELLEKVIRRLDYESNFPGELLGTLHERAERTRNVHVYVFSLSERGNLLSQWRAYCPETGGYSLGFDPQLLTLPLDVSDFRLARCVYAEQQQESLIREAIAYCIENAPDQVHGESNPVGWMFGKLFPQLAPILKNSSFSEEKEWRLITRPISIHDDRVRHREGNTTLIPYLEINVTREEGEFPIEHIFIGPSPHPDLASLSVTSLVTANDVSTSTTPSKIPYRSFS